MVMKNFNESIETKHHLNWVHITDHNFRILISGASASDKTNVLLSLINQ